MQRYAGVIAKHQGRVALVWEQYDAWDAPYWNLPSGAVEPGEVVTPTVVGWSMADAVHFTATQPTKRMAADCLFTDDAGRLLVLQPTYKSTWDLPGGLIERDESPRTAAQREVREEIGLGVEPGELLVLDWVSQSGDFTEIVALVFDGGVLTAADIDRIVLDPTEARTFRFVTLNEAAELLDGGQFGRVVVALETRTSGTTAYLENGAR